MTDVTLKEKPVVESFEDIDDDDLTEEELAAIDQHINHFDPDEYISFEDYLAGKTG